MQTPSARTENSPRADNSARFDNNGTGQKLDHAKSESSRGLVSSEFQKFLADIEDLIKATNTLTGEELAKAKIQLAERIAAAKLSVIGISENIAAKARKTATYTNQMAHDKPWQVIGAGAAVGFVLGLFFSRRS